MSYKMFRLPRPLQILLFWGSVGLLTHRRSGKIFSRDDDREIFESNFKELLKHTLLMQTTERTLEAYPSYNKSARQSFEGERDGMAR